MFVHPAGLVWIASVIVGSPMLFVQQLEVSCSFHKHFSHKKGIKIQSIIEQKLPGDENKLCKKTNLSISVPSCILHLMDLHPSLS